MIYQIVLLAAVAAISAADGLGPINYAPQPYNFGYDIKDKEGQQYRQEEGVGGEAVKGSYGFTDARGIKREVDYVADKAGFRARVKTNEPGTANQNPAAVLMISDAPYAGGLPLGGLGYGLGYNSLGYNNLGYNNLGLNNLGMNNLGMNNLGMNNLGYNNLGYNNLGYGLGLGAYGRGYGGYGRGYGGYGRGNGGYGRGNGGYGLGYGGYGRGNGGYGRGNGGYGRGSGYGMGRSEA